MAELYSFLNMPLTGLNYNNLSFHNGLTLDHLASSHRYTSLSGLPDYSFYFTLTLISTSPSSAKDRSCTMVSMVSLPIV